MINKRQPSLKTWLKHLAPLRASIRLRILGLVLMVVLGTIVLMAFYTLNRFEEASVFQLEHEGLVLSDMLEAAITPLLKSEPDIEALQAHIDRVVELRDKNDIEINILLLQGHRSSIVASNIPDNIEQSSFYEHKDLRESLKHGEPVVFVGMDDDGNLGRPVPSTSPDFYLPPSVRFLSITTPLIVDGQGLGSINTKLSLAQVDRYLSKIRRGILWMGASLPVLALLLFLWAIQRGLRPLDRLAGEVAKVGSSSLSHRFSTEATPTELRPIILRLNELLERLQSAFHRERRFTSNVAHELRTPIATLKVLAEVGIQEASQKSRGDGSLAFYQDTLAVAGQMEHLVVNLLGLVRYESGLQEVAISSIDLGKLIEKAWKTFEPDARERRLDCEINLAEGAVVQSDPTLLEAVFRNLFSNAVSHAKEDGSVLCALENGREYFHFTLANTNNGLTSMDLERLFEPFWRKEESRTDQSHSGIGLSLVSAYTKLLGINIDVELNAPEDLIQFSLRIPMAGIRPKQ